MSRIKQVLPFLVTTLLSFNALALVCPDQKTINGMSEKEAIDFVYSTILRPGNFGMELSLTDGLVFESQKTTNGNKDFLQFVPKLNQDALNTLGGTYRPENDYNGLFRVTYMETEAHECRRQIYITDVDVKTGVFSGYTNVEVCQPELRNAFFGAQQFYSDKGGLDSMDKFFAYLEGATAKKIEDIKASVAPADLPKLAWEIQVLEASVKSAKEAFTIPPALKDRVHFNRIDGIIYPRFSVKFDSLTFTKGPSEWDDTIQSCHIATTHGTPEFTDVKEVERQEFSEEFQLGAFETAELGIETDPDLMFGPPFAVRHWDETNAEEPVSTMVSPIVNKTLAE